jgi:hypothetical protein
MSCLHSNKKQKTLKDRNQNQLRIRRMSNKMLKKYLKLQKIKKILFKVKELIQKLKNHDFYVNI